MRPVRLTMQAFGPFSHRQHLDFRDLGPHALFHIGGETGSGKTTIVDAICYATLGEASGGERAPANMRSDHAPVDLRTEVTLDFQLGAEAFRVTRSPEQRRPKKRGEGFTTEATRATLWERTGVDDDAEDGRVLGTGASEVTREVQRLLNGMTLAQLRQTTVLAQGQFRQVITAPSTDRAKILGTLFDTGRYDRLERRLKRAMADLRDALDHGSTRRDTLLGEAEVATEAALEEVINALVTTVKDAEAKATALSAAAEQARAALAKGHGEQALRDALEKALVAHAALTSQQEAMDAQRLEHRRAETAATLRDVANLARQRQQELEESTLARDDAAALLGRAQEEAEAARRTLGEREAQGPARAKAKEAVDRLSALSQRVVELGQAETDLKTAQAAAAQSVAAETTADEALKEIRAGHETATASLRTAEDAKKGLETLKQAYDAATQRIQAHTALGESRSAWRRSEQARATAEATLKAAIEGLDVARSQAQDLESQRDLALAATLAASLESGEPCPVCGSEAHPSPAHGEASEPTEVALEEARQAVTAAEGQRDTARGELTKARTEAAVLQERIEGLRERLEGAAEVAIEELTAEHGRMQAALAAQTTHAEALAGRQQALEKLTAQAAEAEETCGQAKKDREAATQRVQGHLAIVEERAREVPEELREPSALADALTDATAQAKKLEGALEVAKEAVKRGDETLAARQAKAAALDQALAKTRTRTDDAVAELDKRILEAGFQDREDWEDAHREDVDMATLKKTLVTFDEALSQATAQLSQARAAATDVAPPDLEGLKAASEAAQAALTDHHQALGEQKEGLKVQQGRRAELQRIAAKSAATRRRHEVVGRLAQVANGANGAGLTFERYVLAAMLDDVLVATNQRLRAMSGGRYTLHRAEGVRSRRGRHGLDLEVLDAYTGKSRPATTLSGGEGFEASLALALGLADTVQAQAGGFHLDTIFVDEGFGSLSQDDLDAVVGALEELQAGGRLVGVISHVSELGERIAARLEVVKGRTGSTASFIVP